MLFKKQTEKIVLLQAKGLIQIIFQVQDFKEIMHISIASHPFVWEAHKILPLDSKYCVAIEYSWKGTNWKFIFPWKETNWYVLQMAKALFSYTIWLIISEKSIMVSCFFTMMVHAMYQKSQQTRNIKYKKNVYKNFQFF